MFFHAGSQNKDTFNSWQKKYAIWKERNHGSKSFVIYGSLPYSSIQSTSDSALQIL